MSLEENKKQSKSLLTIDVFTNLKPENYYMSYLYFVHNENLAEICSSKELRV